MKSLIGNVWLNLLLYMYVMVQYFSVDNLKVYKDGAY